MTTLEAYTLLNTHIVSMQTRGGGDKITHSIAVCECGWRNEVIWGNYEEQDAAIESHWASVNFKPQIL